MTNDRDETLHIHQDRSGGCQSCQNTTNVKEQTRVCTPIHKHEIHHA